MSTPELQKVEPRFERRKEARPAELLDAALDLFVERGYAATRLDDVAQRAGVSKGTVYLYFDSKEELFKAVVRDGHVRAIEAAEELVEEFEGERRRPPADAGRAAGGTRSARPAIRASRS